MKESSTTEKGPLSNSSFRTGFLVTVGSRPERGAGAVRAVTVSGGRPYCVVEWPSGDSGVYLQTVLTPYSAPPRATPGMFGATELADPIIPPAEFHEKLVAIAEPAVEAEEALVEAAEAYDPISPAHYKFDDGVEVIDLIEQLPLNPGNAIKYLARAGRKPGAEALTDLHKADFYVQREIARLTRRAAQ
jgi:hypothetical protein